MTPQFGGTQSPVATANTSVTTAQFWSMSKPTTTDTSGITNETPMTTFSFAEHTESPPQPKEDNTEALTQRIPMPDLE